MLVPDALINKAVARCASSVTPAFHAESLKYTRDPPNSRNISQGLPTETIGAIGIKSSDICSSFVDHFCCNRSQKECCECSLQVKGRKYKIIEPFSGTL